MPLIYLHSSHSSTLSSLVHTSPRPPNLLTLLVKYANGISISFPISLSLSLTQKIINPKHFTPYSLSLSLSLSLSHTRTHIYVPKTHWSFAIFSPTIVNISILHKNWYIKITITGMAQKVRSQI